ncbi:PREDICTED: uncharacterized protein LOC109474390 [Branchiostoma belcheri]|uniref:Uncharacterized protein LOC109474390 n=1 Tax=Branchiostoma belcheri TaxID=7741 RepID=A0A6P4Z8P0_BRABE|nr:PREDICTED: uncharacterized protein LOC109474390 [Branchiostoma belcheri]
MPWWRVDLGRSLAIGSVVVFNRQDCCQERLNNFRVHVGDSSNVTSNPQCGGDHAVTSGQQRITVDCDGLRGRYVGISLPRTDILTLCEVQVYGVPRELEQDPSWVVGSAGTPYVSGGVTYDAAKVFDGDNETYWNPQGTSRYHNNWYITLDLTESKTLIGIAVNNFGDTTHDIAVFTLQKSLSASPYIWQDVVTVTGVQGGTSQRQEFFGFQGTARYWRLLITQTHSGYQPTPTELNLYELLATDTELSDLTFSEIGIDQMTLSWTASADLDITRYGLRYRHAGTSYLDLSPPPAPNDTTVTVRGLWAGTEYNFTLTAFGENDEQIGEISGTETTAEVIVTVDCRQDHMSVTFPRAALTGVDVDTMHLLNDTCRATYTETEVTLGTGLQECGTIQESSGDKLIFSNEAIGSPVVQDNGAVRGTPFSKSFQCEFVSQFVISQEQNILFNIPPSRLQVVNAKNQFTFEMHMFPSADFARTYTSADYPVRVSSSDQLHFGLSVNSPLDNLELFALHCLATPSTDPDDTPSVSIIQDGCDIDQTLQLNNALSGDMALYYSIQSFTFPNVVDPSLVYIHCTMVVCFKDDPNSRCNEGCMPYRRRRRAVSDMSEARVRRASETDQIVRLSQGPFEVVGEEKQASAVPTVGIAAGTAAGIAGVLLMVAAVFLVRKRRGRDVKEQAEDRVGFDNYSFELWGKGKATNATPKPE